MKTSLVISDKEKYGPSSPMVSSVSDKPSKPEERKSAPTLELTGPQVEAFGLAKPAVGDKGCVTIDFVVKSVRAGSEYGDGISATPSPIKVTVQVTHAEPEDESDESDEGEEGDGEDDESEEDAATEKAEEESGEDLDGDDEEGEPAAHKSKVKGKKKKPAAEKDAESAATERVSPDEADLP